MKEELTPTSDTRRSGSTASAEISILVRLTILICLMLLFTELCSAQVSQTIKSATSGDWNTRTTWIGGNIPKAEDNVQITDGHKIALNAQVSCNSLELVPPANSDKTDEKSELVLGSGAALTTGTLNLNSKNDRRYASLINNGATITAGTLIIGRGSILENTTGTIAVLGNVSNSGDIITSTATLKIGGTYSGTGIFTKGTGTVEYTGTAATGQTIADIAYHHLKLSGSNTKTPAADLLVSGNLQIEPGTTLRAGLFNHSVTGDIRNNGTLSSDAVQPSSITLGNDMLNAGITQAGAATYYVNGDWNNTGTFQAGTSTIVLKGNTLQNISGNNTFYNLQFSGTAKAQLLQDISITNGISVTNSHLQTGANSVLLGPNANLTTLETDASHIIGTVKTSRTLTPSAPEDFGNIGLTLTRNDVDPGMITVERLTGVTTEIIDGTESVTRQYNLSRSGISDVTALSMTMDLTFLPNELASKPLNEYKLYNKNPNQGALPVQSNAISQTTMRHTNSNRFGTFTLAPPITPMPVELVWFRASSQDRVVVLQWKTASEKDNQGFEVQLSSDGHTFAPLGFVSSKSPDSHVAQLYTFTDNNPKRGTISYYRLKQQDYSGKVSYSNIQTIGASKSTFSFQALPNPFTDQIKFASGATSLQVTLTDLNGKAILQQQLTTNDLAADGYYHLNTATLNTSGIYLLTVQTPEQVHRTKLLRL